MQTGAFARLVSDRAQKPGLADPGPGIAAVRSRNASRRYEFYPGRYQRNAVG